MEKYAMRHNLVLICINLSFINLSSGVAIFFWWEVLIFYNTNRKYCEPNAGDKELCSHWNGKEFAFMNLGSFYLIEYRNERKLHEI